MSFEYSKQAAQKADVGCPTTVTDVDHHSYNTVLIGKQCWMAENLRVRHFRDGAAVDDEQMAVIDVDKFGLLYRWAAVTHPSGLCPTGWHVPSDAEFQQLELAVGMAPDVVKETGWRGANDEARKLKQFVVASSSTPEMKALVNASGFSALPAGGSSGAITGADGLYSDFWTSTEHDDERAWYRSQTWFSLHPNRTRIRRVHVDKAQGSSVRCLLDG